MTIERGEGLIRAFVAVEVPDGVRDRIAGVRGAWEEGVRGVRWVEPANLHLTLKFLGETAPEALAGAGGDLTMALAARKPFPVRWGGVGVFPNPRRPRVLFLDLEEGKEDVVSLAGTVERVLVGRGFAPESRETIPHLTVGRVNDPRTVGGVEGWLRENAHVAAGGGEIRRVVLVRSELRPSGPRYTVLEEYPLGASLPAP
jgi:2'-5' RNA ligase